MYRYIKIMYDATLVKKYFFKSILCIFAICEYIDLRQINSTNTIINYRKIKKKKKIFKFYFLFNMY